MSLVENQKGMTNLIPCNSEYGGDYEQYSFGQSDSEVVVKVPLPENVTSKMLVVNIAACELTVGIKGHKPIISGNLYKPIKSSESTWCVEDKRMLIVTLIKTNLQYEEWWPCVTVDERQIDMKTFKPPSKHISELDDSAQATIARMMFDQRQKTQNLPTSDELELQELMRRSGGPK
ncbi:putative nuclear movement protein [Trypanosoma vivax]|nr:putative nuclear movement protein [Trypanosoma vivax]